MTDPQKIEAQEAYTRPSTVPGASPLEAVDRHIAHLETGAQSVTLEVLGARVVAERQAVGGRGAGEATIIETNSRWGRFARGFPNRLASTITPAEVNDWIRGLDMDTGGCCTLSSSMDVLACGAGYRLPAST